MVTLSLQREALAHNYRLLADLAAARGVSLMVVTKAVCSFGPLVSFLAGLGADTVGDSQPAVFAQPGFPAVTKALLKAPPSAFGGTEAWDYALVSHDAVGAGTGAAVIVVELGDGKDGVLPREVVPLARRIQAAGRRVLGLACNFSCLLGRQPDAEAWRAFEAAGRELAPLVDGKGLFSAGGTVALDDVASGAARGVSQLRVGEGLLLGRDSSRGSALEGFADGTARLEAEVIEVGDKAFDAVPLDGKDAFGRAPLPPPRGVQRRAVLDLGSLAAGAEGLTPLTAGITLAGQTFDFMAAVLTGEARDLRPGDRVAFRPDYGALSQAGQSPFVRKMLS